jgi:hypothetical protein
MGWVKIQNGTKWVADEIQPPTPLVVIKATEQEEPVQKPIKVNKTNKNKK